MGLPRLPKLADLEPPNDYQQTQLYAAEEVLDDYLPNLPNLWEIKVFLDRVLNSDAIKRRYGPYSKVSITVKPDYDPEASARGGYSDIILPAWAWAPHIVLHEIAHVLAQRIYGRRHIEAHGAQFCGIYLRLVTVALGRSAGALLLRSFGRYNLQVGCGQPKHDPNLYHFKVRVAQCP